MQSSWLCVLLQVFKDVFYSKNKQHSVHNTLISTVPSKNANIKHS